MSKKRLFIAMPYGKRKAPLDVEAPDNMVLIDFDSVWSGLIKPALPKDYEVKRADELHRPGLIDLMYTEWLYEADLVLADLTFGNPNVFYELGIRQALSKKGTVLVACKDTRPPFDVRNQSIINYDYFAAPMARTFQAKLREAIRVAESQVVDSPVHVYLPGLYVTRSAPGASPEDQISALRAQIAEAEQKLAQQLLQSTEYRLQAKIDAAESPSRLRALLAQFSAIGSGSLLFHEQFAIKLTIKLRKYGLIDEAIAVLQGATSKHPNDPELLRELGFCFRKKGPSFYPQAETHMLAALKLNDADGELHGMYGGLLKRRKAYAEARVHYMRAYEVDPGLYPTVNLGAIAAALQDLEEAKNWYKAVESLCEQAILNKRADYWTYLCLAEALVAKDSGEKAGNALADALRAGAPPEDLASETEQLKFFESIGFFASAARDAQKILAAARP